MVDSSMLHQALSHTVSGLTLQDLGLGAEVVHYSGKVRENFSLPGGRRVLVTTDRISAFDRVLGTLPFKGQVLNRLSTWWFSQTEDVAPNHVLQSFDPQAILAHSCAALPVEWVVRSYLTGVTSTSIWTAYARGERSFAGHALPDGLRKNDPLPSPILTPSTKAEKNGHDETVSRETVLERGLVSPALFEEAEAMVLRLFRRGQAIAESRGLILVDTKYELGLDPEGRLRVIDEIHTPDSSRYWFRGSLEENLRDGREPESFDKEYVRRHLAAAGFVGEGPVPPLSDEVRVEAARRYIAAYEKLVGEPFVPDTSPPVERISTGLARALMQGAAS